MLDFSTRCFGDTPILNQTYGVHCQSIVHSNQSFDSIYYLMQICWARMAMDFLYYNQAIISIKMGGKSRAMPSYKKRVAQSHRKFNILWIIDCRIKLYDISGPPGHKEHI